MNKNLEIRRENAMAAYANTDARGRELLENLFGKDIFVKKDITERVKTFEDACAVLGDEHPLVEQHRCTDIRYKGDPKTEDLIAYLKLRIITAALNEGWEPQFTVDECRYYPVFEFFTQREFNEMSDDKKRRVVGRVYHNSSAGGYLVFAYASIVPSFSCCDVGSRLVLKTRELAEYAGRQFIELYADFEFPEKA